MATTNRVTTAEYYCEYKIERVFGDKELVTPPKIYFERDYRTPDLPYSMFAVPEEWLNKQESVLADIRGNTNPEITRRSLDKLAYDTVKLVYDIKGISCAPLADIESDEYKNAEITEVITFEKFYQMGCRIIIENNHSQDHSGIGLMEMYKANVLVARFYFAINFTFRKKIVYKLQVTGDKLNLEFQCKDRPVGVPIAVVYNRDRLPCLRNDMGINKVAELILDFSKSSTYKIPPIKLIGSAANKENVFSITISDEKISKFYILDCLENTSLNIKHEKEFYPKVSYSCPYCHKPIDYSIAKDARYKKGGIPCSSIADKGKPFPVVLSKHRSKLKRCIYCAEDLKPDDISTFKNNRDRLLPPGYMEHDNFKIAFVGSTRAGKTTYISRFFGLTGDKKVSMPMTMTINSMKEFGINIKAASIAKVDRIAGGGYQVTDTNWPDERSEYVERSISLDPPHYPDRSPSGDLTPYPFIAEVNNRAYISFYDIAGEDAQHSMQVKNISNGELIGIFCIINGKTDVAGNNDVFRMLKDAKLSKKCPVAVIVTKFDLIENDFDSNCFCLRSDYFDDAGNKYTGEPIEWEIDYSSEEIKSYLKQTALMPDFIGAFDNVKYFAVSSFNFIDSIHEELEDINTPGRVKFECSSKRIELPFLWMLKQFGLMK